MKANEVNLGTIYYIVIYDSNEKGWEILCRKIESIEPMSNGCVFCHYKDGGVSNDFVFDKLIDAIGKQNRLNVMRYKEDRGLFYNGKIIWLKTAKYGLVKSIITEINWQPIVPTFRLRPMPYTEFAKEFPDFVMTYSISEISDKFTLIPYAEE